MRPEDWKIIRRQLARRSLIYYMRQIAPWFLIEEIHCVIASFLEAMADGEIDRGMIFMPPRTGKPVSDDTLVLRGDGARVPLRDIRVGDLVVTDKGRPCSVEAVHVQGDLPTVEIITKAGRRLVAAPDHPVLTPRGMVAAGFLKPGEVVGIPNGVADLGATGRPEEFRLAGYFIGDGNTTLSGAGLLASNITCHDPDQASDIRACVAAMGFTEGRSSIPTRIPVGGGARQWLRDCGMAGIKSIHKRVPAFVFGGGNTEIANFVGAYFACDGSIFKRSMDRFGHAIEFGSASEGLLRDVQHLLMRLGIAANLKPRNGKDQIGRPYPSWRLTLGSENEVAKFAERIPVFGVKAARLSQVSKGRVFEADYLSDQIVSVGIGPVAPCRCLTVAEDSTFLAGDIIVHNSQMGSVFFPSWWAGRFPSDKILQTGHSLSLSRGFSLDVRSIMQDPEYRFIFPGVRLAKNSKAAGKWRVEDTLSGMAEVEAQQMSAIRRQQQGQYNAAGVTSNIAGIGFNLGVVDDAMSEQDKDSKITKDRIWNWWPSGFYTRRQPERNAILLMMTRWARDDLAGRLLEAREKVKGADAWEVLNVPAILDHDTAKKVYTIAKEYGEMRDIRELKAGTSFSPRRWSEEELERSRANMPERDWNALYLGNPDVDEGHILKAKNWRLWPHADLPEFIEIFQMYDTAFDKKEINDFSARSTWGLFEYRESVDVRPTIHMMMLSAWEQKVDAPDLSTVVKAFAWGTEETRDAMWKERRSPDFDFLDDFIDRYGEVDPDRPNAGKQVQGEHPNRIMVEKKASGLWLVKELRRINHPRRLPIFDWLPPRAKGGLSKGQEMGKYARAHYGNYVLEQGAVWYPKRRWATAVIKKCAETKFDDSDPSDDLQDTIVASMIFVRQTFRVDLPSDRDEEAEKAPKKKVKRQAYGNRS